MKTLAAIPCHDEGLAIGSVVLKARKYVDVVLARRLRRQWWVMSDMLQITHYRPQGEAGAVIGKGRVVLYVADEMDNWWIIGWYVKNAALVW